MTKTNETISRLKGLKEHFISIRKIDECTDYTKHIAAIDEAVILIENMQERIQEFENGKRNFI